MPVLSDRKALERYFREMDWPLPRMIHFLLHVNGLSQTEIARRAGVHPSLVCHVLRGQRRNPMVLQQIARSLGWSVDDIEAVIGLDGDRRSAETA